MAISNPLQTLDIKKIIEQSAYFLLLNIILEWLITFTLFTGLFALDVTGLLSSVLDSTPSATSTRLTCGFLWGVSRAIKTQYTSLSKAPAILISLLFILSIGAVAPEPFTSAETIYMAIQNPQKQKQSTRIKTKANPTNTRLTVFILTMLCLFVLLIPGLIIAFIPFWLFLHSGYLLTRIYFKRPASLQDEIV